MNTAFPKGAPNWRRYLRFWRRDVHADTDDEIRLHLEARVDDLVASGVAPEAARVQAIEEFGDVDGVRRDLRRIDGEIERKRSRHDVLGALRDDLRYTVRSLTRSRAFVLMVVTAMALGLGLNAAMFTFIDEVFFRPPAGVSDPGSVRRVWVTDYNTATHQPVARNFTNYPGYAAMSNAAGRDLPLAVYSISKSARIGHGEGAPTVVRAYTTSNYVAVLGARLARGRWYTAAESEFESAAPVSVVSAAYARRQHIDVGARLTVDNVVTNVIGIFADEFTGPDLDAVDVWMPIGLDQDKGGDGKPWWQSPYYFGLMMVARDESATNEAVLAQRLTAAERASIGATHYGDTTGVVGFGPINYNRGGDVAPEIQVATRLGLVALLVLVIACANVINLLLARAVMRRRELAVRVALGVTRGRLVRLMATESILLALLAGGAAIVAAYWGGTLLRRLLLPGVHWADSPLSWRVIAFTALASVATGAIIGVIPAIRASAPNLGALLRGAGDHGTPHRTRLRTILIGLQAALTLVLLATSLLFIASLRNVEGLDIGFDAQRLLFAKVRFESRPAAWATLTDQAYHTLAAEIAGAPGVESVALSSIEPMRGMSWFSKVYVGPDSLGALVPDPGKEPTFTAVSSSYFQAAGTRFVRGSAFEPHAHAVVVNQEMVRLVWHGANPIGTCMRFQSRSGPCYTVVGVARDARRGRVVESNRYAQYYLPIDNMPFKDWGAGTVIIRAEPRMMPAVMRDVRDRLHRILPSGEPVLKRMTDYLEPDYRPFRLGATLFTAFGVLALIVTLVGIYSTVAYGVQQRSHEFSIRVALGATLGDVVGSIVARELRVLVVGLAIGAAIVIVGGRFIASLLYGVAPTDPIVLSTVAALLVVAAVVASLGPAWRAGRADPVDALRSE